MRIDKRNSSPGRTVAWRLVGMLLLCAAGLASSAPATAPIITTIAGGGSPASGNGDGGQATDARLTQPIDVAVDAAGNVYVADVAVFVGQDGFKVRRIDTSGVITTVAGNGTTTYNGDGIAATSAGISVKGIAVDGAGNLYIADAHNQRIRKVTPAGIISTVAGNGQTGFSGDGGVATSARLNYPSDVAVDATGNLYILDTFNVRVRKVGTDGVISTVAGNGQSGFSGDGGPGPQASLASIAGLAVDGTGVVYIADKGNDRVRRVGTDGRITTFAGGGRFRSDPVATNMKLLHPNGVVVDSRGNVYIAEMNNIVRMVSRHGILQVVAGDFNDTTFGTEGAWWGFSGDGGPATQAQLYEPMNLALDAQENLYIADSRNGRVRKVTTVPTPATPLGLGAFNAPVIREVGSFTKHVAVADVTGDGRDDALLVTGGWGGPGAQPDNDFRLWVFIQQPDGTLAAPIKRAFLGDSTGGRSGSGLAVGDLDRDGFKDVVVGTLDGVAIYRGHPGGVHEATLSPGLDNVESVNSVAILDVDRDGRLDIATLGCCRSEGGSSPTDLSGMTVHYGDGVGGVWRRVLFPAQMGMAGANLRAVDINHDGVTDLLKTWSDGTTGGVDLLIHNRINAFLPPVRLTPAVSGRISHAYATGDFNGDGRLDIVISRDGNAPSASYVQFEQDALGRFREVRDWRGFDIPAELLAADIGGDGRDDLLVIHAGWSSLGLHARTGLGLDTEVKYQMVQSGHVYFPGLASGDLNGDGCRDAAMADYNYGLVVMTGRQCARMLNGSMSLLRPRTAGAASTPPQAMAQGTAMSAGNTAATQVRDGYGTGAMFARMSVAVRARLQAMPVRVIVGGAGVSILLLLALSWWWPRRKVWW